MFNPSVSCERNASLRKQHGLYSRIDRRGRRESTLKRRVVALADYDHNRRGFKNWLFGTDDIFANSWMDETSALRTRLKQLRETRKA